MYWGVSGGGKSHKAWSENPEAYDKDDTKWWTGYNGQDVVIWDDFDPTQISDVVGKNDGLLYLRINK